MVCTWSSAFNTFGYSSTEEDEAAARSKRPNLGVKELVPCGTADFDIVAIHGLNGDREETWTADNGRLWLRDFLPQDIAVARILTYGYDAYVYGRKRLSEPMLNGHARDFVAKLAFYRKVTQSTDRLIIFVAHNLGGIILKSALIHSNVCHDKHLPDHRTIYDKTLGIIFLGTPNQGTKIMYLGADVKSIRSSNIDDTLVKHLRRNSEMLQRQIAQYLPINRKFKTYYLYETLGTRISGLARERRETIISKVSAVLPGDVNVEAVGLHKTHRNLGKFESREEDDYRTVIGSLNGIIKQSKLEPTLVYTPRQSVDEEVPIT